MMSVKKGKKEDPLLLGIKDSFFLLICTDAYCYVLIEQQECGTSGFFFSAAYDKCLSI